MKNFVFGGLALLLASCAPAYSGDSFDAQKVEQEIKAYAPDVTFVQADGLYVVVEDTVSSLVQQRLDNLTPGVLYKATFSSSNTVSQSVNFTVDGKARSVVTAPKLAQKSVMDSGPAAASLPPTIDLAVYNINAYYLLLKKDGQAVTSVATLAPGAYQWAVIRGGFSSTPTNFSLAPSQTFALKLPDLSAFIADAVAVARQNYYSANGSSAGSSGGMVPVRGYYRSNGTYVAPYYRSAPRR